MTPVTSHCTNSAYFTPHGRHLGSAKPRLPEEGPMDISANLTIEVKNGSVLLLFKMDDGNEVAVDVHDLAMLSDNPERRLLLEWCNAHKSMCKLEAQKRSGRAG
jgi:hypothetical protein